MRSLPARSASHYTSMPCPADRSTERHEVGHDEGQTDQDTNPRIIAVTLVRIPTADPAGTAARLLPQMGTDTAGLQAIEVVRPSLESVFLTVTGRRYEPLTADAAA